jgi:pimeloyl-ACP methyl ester carboxylesterase
MSVTTRALEIEVDAGTLDADLALPKEARGVVLFAHGSGSSRRSPRNLYVASRLHLDGFGTLLFDLLTPREQLLDDRTRELRFDVPLLAARLSAATGALAFDRSLPAWRGYFGASTGAAAALVAAVTERNVGAVVSRGGRPDLAGDALESVRAPTLLIVGGDDTVVLDLNEQALRRLQCVKELAVVPGATHLFEEPGALDDVCDHATAWFDRHCPNGQRKIHQTVRSRR